MENRKQITATWLERTRLNDGEIQWRSDLACAGLIGRISYSEKRGRSASWYYRYKNASYSDRFHIADYPATSLDEARQIVQLELRPIAKAGQNVKAVWKRQQSQAAEEGNNTFRTLIPEYLASAKREGLAEGTVASYRRYLRPLAHWWGERDPREINRGDCQDLFYRVQEEGVPPYDIDGTELKGGRPSGGNRAAGLTLSAARGFFTWLLDREKVEFNPWAGQKKLAKRGASGIADRALSDDEIKIALASKALNHRDRTILRFMLATGLRPNEVCSAEWREIDLEAGVWSIPKGRMKYKGAGHTVYLSDYLAGILNAWRKTQRGKPRYVFPAAGEKNPHVMADNLVQRFRSIGIEGFTPKVCRATVRTGLQRLGCPLEVRQHMSHHQQGDRVQKAYDQHDYSPEARHWWQQWGTHLSLLDKGEKGLAEVVKMRASA